MPLLLNLLNTFLKLVCPSLQTNKYQLTLKRVREYK